MTIRCTHCGHVTARQSPGLCTACFQYRWRTKRDRPRHLWTGEPLHCPICGAARPKGVSGRGLCGACQVSWNRHGGGDWEEWAARRREFVAPGRTKSLRLIARHQAEQQRQRRVG